MGRTERRGEHRSQHRNEHRSEHRTDRRTDDRIERKDRRRPLESDKRRADYKRRAIKEEPIGDSGQKRMPPNEDYEKQFWSKEAKVNAETETAVEKAKPNFALTGKLAEDTNVFNGVVIKYNEPLEARKPKRKWRLYPFKGEESLPFVPIHRQSAYLLGRDRKVADIPVDHPSCSKQHAVLQFRLVDYQREDSTLGKRVRPYVIDLESSNGTFVNNQQIESKRYYELFEKDVLKFGFSTREYVLLHEESKDETEDDDIDAKSSSNVGKQSD